MVEKQALEKLRGLLGKRQVLTDPAALVVYERDAALDRGMPDAVVFVQSLKDVQAAIAWAAEYQVPLVSRGAGTGLSGGAVAEQGGVILEFSRMRRILEIDPLGRSAAAEPGVVNLALDEAVRKQGLYYPPDPASGRSATLGGNVGENAGGPHCFKYGVTTNYLTGLQFALPDGQTLDTGGAAYDYPEYDFTGLIAGSEGTLAVVTRLQVRLLRNPPGVKTMMAAFDSVETAGKAVSAVISAGLTPSSMEMMDQKIVRIVEEFAHADLPTGAGAILIIDVDGYPDSLNPQIEEIAGILQDHGGSDLRIAHTPEAREKIWYGRKSAAGAMARLAPAYLLLDGTVPRSALARALETSNEICDRYGLQVGYVFHAGDGNLHPFILVDPRDLDLMQRAHQAGREFMEAVVALGGSITGEHGVGIDKRPYLSLMIPPEELRGMREVKAIFDPEQRFNPGKIFPPVEADTYLPGAVFPLPDAQFAPASLEEAAQGLAALTRSGEPVQILGGSPAAQPLPPGRILSTCNLSGIQTYAPQDLYVTAGAGMPIAELQAFLSREGRQAPLRSPWPQATLGGLIAANLNSPLRMRYGALRDQVLGMSVVLGDGRCLRLGRPVVKNVAGYDLPKALVGSYGTLGVIGEVTLKINALPRLRSSLVYPVETLERGVAWAQAALSTALVASGVLLGSLSHGYPLPEARFVLVYSAEGLPEDVQTELSLVRERLAELGAPEPLEVDGEAAAELWARFLAASWEGRLLLRAGAPPKEAGAYLLAREAQLLEGEFLADLASGLIYVAALPDGLGEAQAWLDSLRKPALAAGGYTVVLAYPHDWDGRLDRWGYQPQTLDLMQRLKARWDPAGVLNPGVFLV